MQWRQKATNDAIAMAEAVVEVASEAVAEAGEGLLLPQHRPAHKDNSQFVAVLRARGCLMPSCNSQREPRNL